jgi:hypothetical protein
MLQAAADRQIHRCAAPATLGLLTGLVLAACAVSLGAQPAPVAAGVTAASFAWKDGRREQAIGTVVQVAPRPWIVFGAVPTALRVTGADGARTGLADLPVYAGVSRRLSLPLAPTVAIASVASLPTGDAERGLGRGETIIGGEATLSIAPAPRLILRGGGARLLRDGGLVPDGAPHATLFGDAVVTIGTRTNASVGYAAELGDARTSPYAPGRSLNAALVRTIAGSTALLAGAGRTLRGVGPAWSLSLGVGTAFGGVSPVGASSVRGRSPTGTTPGSGTSAPLAPATRDPSLCGLLPAC